MPTRTEIRFGGSGGQGIVLAAQILGNAAALEGKHSLQTQAYGAEARGSFAKSEVIISDARIGFPAVRRPDVLVVMSQESLDTLLRDLKEDGVLIVDSSNVKLLETAKRKLYSVPEARRNEIKAIIKQAVADGVSDARSRLTESFYQNSLYTSLTTLAPDGWKVSTNVKLQSGAAMLNLDLTIADDTGRVAGVELNMGPPGQHLYALIGKALVSGAKPLQMLILVLLATHARDYDFLRQIRSANSRPRFGVILREMPVESETTFAEGVAKEILNTIRSSR